MIARPFFSRLVRRIVRRIFGRLRRRFVVFAVFGFLRGRTIVCAPAEHAAQKAHAKNNIAAHKIIAGIRNNFLIENSSLFAFIRLSAERSKRSAPEIVPLELFEVFTTEPRRIRASRLQSSSSRTFQTRNNRYSPLSSLQRKRITRLF